MKVSRLGRLSFVLLVAGLLGWGASIDLPLAAQGSEVQEIAAALDTNGNQVLDDGEIRQAVQLWIGGSTVPGTTRTISDATILKLIQLWVTGEKITGSPGPTGSLRIQDVYFLNLDAAGQVTSGTAITSAPTGSLITISGTSIPTNVLVQMDGIETTVIDHSNEALITFVPYVGAEPKTVDIVVSDKNNSVVNATKRFTIEPLKTGSVVDPAKTIGDFITAARSALAAAPSGSKADETLQMINRLESAFPAMSDGERRVIAAVMESSNALGLVGKVQGAASAANLQTVLMPANPEFFGLFLLFSPYHVYYVVLSMILELIFPTVVDFAWIPGQVGEPGEDQRPIEGQKQGLSCRTFSIMGVSRISIAMQAGSETHFLDAAGQPTAARAVERVFNIFLPGFLPGIETYEVDWNSTQTGSDRDVTFTCSAATTLMFLFGIPTTKTLTLKLMAQDDTPPPPAPMDCTTQPAGTFVAKWGSLGDGDGQFHDPADVALDSVGNLYVVDRENVRIQKLDANGVFLTKWGSNGPGIGQFSYPSAAILDSAGKIYVADTANNRIARYDANGQNPQYIGSFGTGDGQFSGPQGVAVDSAGNLYVADGGNHRIQKFDANGDFLGWLGSNGSGDEQFSFPAALTVDGAGNLYVADTGNHRIQRFNSNGDFTGQIGSEGSGNGQFSFPTGLALDSAGNLYVVDQGNNRIQKFDVNGDFVAQWGSQGSGDGQFNQPVGVALDSMGNVYIADTGNHRIQKFCPGL